MTTHHFVVASQFESVARVFPQSSDDLLYLGTIVLGQEAMTIAAVLHLQGELIVARSLGPQQPQ